MLHERAFFNVEGYRASAANGWSERPARYPEIGVGLIAELDSGDAYRSVHRTRWTLIGLAMILGFGLLLIDSEPDLGEAR